MEYVTQNNPFRRHVQQLAVSALPCGHPHFEANLKHMAPIGSLETNQISCILSGCHATIHNASEVAHLKI